MHVPRALQELALRVRAQIDELSRELGRWPTPTEVAHALDEPVEAVIEALEGATARHAVSLDAEPGCSDSQGTRRGIKALPARDQLIPGLRFGEGMTQAQIAERIGVSQMHVSRLIRRALDRLRAMAEYWLT